MGCTAEIYSKNDCKSEMLGITLSTGLSLCYLNANICIIKYSSTHKISNSKYHFNDKFSKINMFMPIYMGLLIPHANSSLNIISYASSLF